MSLLDIFRKSREKTSSASTSTVPSLGKMWVCVVKFEPWNDDWYDVMIKNVDISEAYMRGKDVSVTSLETDPFNSPVKLYGKVGRLEYNQSSSRWVGFFDAKEKAEDAYRKLVSSLVDHIESMSRKVLQTSDAVAV